jgi:hypothetical protein
VEKIVQFSELIAPKPSAINQKRNDYRGKTGAKNCTRARKKPGARSASGSPRFGWDGPGKTGTGEGGANPEGQTRTPEGRANPGGVGRGVLRNTRAGGVGVVSNSIKGSGALRGQHPGATGHKWEGQTRTPEGRANPNPRGPGKPEPPRAGQTRRGKPAPGRAGKTGTGEGGENRHRGGRGKPYRGWPVAPGCCPRLPFVIGLGARISGQKKGEGKSPLRCVALRPYRHEHHTCP